MRNLALAQIDGLSARAINCCNDVGIATIGDLFDYIKSRSLSTIKNCGSKTVRELNQLISDYESKVSGYQYNLFAVDNPVQELNEPSTADTQCVVVNMAVYDEALDSTEIVSVLNDAYLERLDQSNDPLAEKVRAKFPNAESILLIVSHQPENLLAYYDDWSIEDHFKFWTFCKELLDDMLQMVDEDYYPALRQSLGDAISYLQGHIKGRKLTLLKSRIRVLHSTIDE